MMNPLDLPGPEFLLFYVFVLFFALLAGGIVRFLLRSPGGKPPAEADTLNAYQIAMLSGGKSCVVHAVLAGLVQRELIKPSRANGCCCRLETRRRGP